MGGLVSAGFGRLDPNNTDLAAGLRLARSLLPEDRAKNIVLITDGKENRGNSLELAKFLARQGVRLDVLPVAADPGPEVLDPGRFNLIGTLPAPAVQGELPVWPLLLLIVVMLFPIDIALRRFNWNLRWIGPVQEKILVFGHGSPRARIAHGQEVLMDSLKQRRERRREFYNASGGQVPLFRPIEQAHEPGHGPAGRSPNQGKQDTGSATGITADGSRPELTSRLLAAKKRVREQDKKGQD